jgi:hypothetical protein
MSVDQAKEALRRYIEANPGYDLAGFIPGQFRPEDGPVLSYMSGQGFEFMPVITGALQELRSELRDRNQRL